MVLSTQEKSSRRTSFSSEITENFQETLCYAATFLKLVLVMDNPFYYLPNFQNDYEILQISTHPLDKYTLYLKFEMVQR